MDKVPLMFEGRAVGELTAVREGLYTRYSAVCRLPGEGVWCAWVLGERGELRIGVLEPCGTEATISRRFSDRVTAPLGSLQSGELRPIGAGPASTDWKPIGRVEDWFHTSWLCDQLRHYRGVLAVREGERCRVAIPYDPRQPFPIPSLFCFAHVIQAAGQRCVVYIFNHAEHPIFDKDRTS